MKRAFALLLSLLMLCSLLTACGGNETAGGDEKEQETQSGQTDNPDGQPVPDEVQTLSILHSAEPSVLDVARFLGIADRSLFYNVLEPLVRIENGVPAAAGAESWSFSDDDLTLTFTLRDNCWSDGQPVTSEDYATALRRQADPKNAFAFASDYYA
ncbi:MAG: ABC transporter substrate-binding protein, partial [Clostridia bacterium]|nr:ABC transporter substrate-binding protein [Clostridia bacterium]